MKTLNGYHPGRYASIDIGTVTCRLLIADIDEQGRLIEVYKDREITNLGEGVDATGRLSDAAMERVAKTMDRFVSGIIAHAGDGLPEAATNTSQSTLPLRPVVIATSASRDAENSDEFAALLAKRGLELAIIPGEKEAALSFLGATQGFEGERVVVVDSGGGSTEVVAGIAGKTPEMAHSFNIGCRRVTERFLADDPEGPIDAEAMERARAWMRDEMSDYFERLRTAGHLPARMIAVAGTATSAVSVREAMEVYDPARVHGSAVSRTDLDSIYERLARLPLAERQKVTGLEARRAPVICAGFATLAEVMALADVDSYTVSESDILQGAVLDAAKA